MNIDTDPNEKDQEQIPSWSIDSVGSWYCPECHWYASYDGRSHSRYCKWHGVMLKDPQNMNNIKNGD